MSNPANLGGSPCFINLADMLEERQDRRMRRFCVGVITDFRCMVRDLRSIRMTPTYLNLLRAARILQYQQLADYQPALPIDIETHTKNCLTAIYRDEVRALQVIKQQIRDKAREDRRKIKEASFEFQMKQIYRGK